MSADSDSPRFDRRQFTKQLAAISGAATTLLLPSDVSVAEEQPSVVAQDKPAEDAAAQKPVEPAEDRERVARPSEELLLLNLLIQRYPSENFDDAALRGIFGELRGDLARGRVLSAFPLRNADEPSFVFRAFLAPE